MRSFLFVVLREEKEPDTEPRDRAVKEDGAMERKKSRYVSLSHSWKCVQGKETVSASSLSM